tara:strand:- start:19647 stop:20426 length:780 start_codon:yes stop_codon:yes gene_type:complete
MKTAVILSGQPRNLEDNYKNLLSNFVDCNDADLFCHFWDDPQSYGEYHRPDREMGNVTTKHQNIDDLVKDIKATRSVIEQQVDFQYNPFFCETYGREIKTPVNDDFPTERGTTYSGSKIWTHATFPTWGARPGHNISQWYSWKQALLLLKSYEQEKDFRYDAIIRTRTDFRINSPFTITGPIEGVLSSKPTDHTDYSINDHIGIGKRDYMFKYLSIIDYINEYYFFDKIPFNTEVYLGWHLKKQRIPVSFMNFETVINR